jgi:hypothetical protein
VRTGWFIALVLTVMTVSSGLAQSIPNNMLKTETMRPLPTVAATELQLKGFAQPSARADAAYTFMSNKTRLVASPGVPLQVVYTSADGVAALWFPANGEVRRGRWYVQEKKWDLTENGVPIKSRYLTSICFDYSGAVPNIFGPAWQREASCMSLAGRQQHTLDRRDGDVFALTAAQRKTPLGPVATRKLDELKRQ